jgi:hypothetical protein
VPFLRKSALLLFVSMSLSAQNYPMPGALEDPPVICTGCPGNNGAGEPNAGKPTFPFGTPLSVHTGRYVDSQNTLTVQNVGMRTVRAGLVRTAPASRNRLYLGLGATVGAYTLDTFFTGKLQTPMVPVNTIPTGSPYGGRNPYEKLARPDRFFYPEASSPSWNTPIVDSSEVLRDFDVDDRGYVYVATANFAWGIISDPGGTDGSRLPSVWQMTDTNGFFGTRTLFSFRVGASYYAYVTNSDWNQALLMNVTTPASPSILSHRSGVAHGAMAWSKYEAGERVAFIGADGHLRVYTYAGLVAGTAPLVDMTWEGGNFFRDLSFDDDGNIWVAESPSGGVTANVLRKLTPSGDTYTATTYDIYGSAFSPRWIHASAGYVAVGGQVTANGGQANDLRLLKVVEGAPQLLDTGGFFANYYHRAPSGFANPAGFSYNLNAVRIVPQGGKTYLFYSALGLGDVFEISEGPRITSFAPLSGIPAGGTNVTIYGSGFAPGATVTFDGVLASSSFVSATQMTAVTPMHASGAVDVVVTVPAQAPMTALKKYTYALVAPQVVATATSTTSINVSWNAVEGATHYEVSRRLPNGSWDIIGTPSATSLVDGGRTAETTYVYRVRAFDAALNASPYSASDLATTMGSDSAAITPGMVIRAADMILLRSRANAVRTASGMSEYQFTGTVSGVVLAQNITQVRSALSQARTQLGLTTPTFTDPSVVGVRIKAVHFNELLELMR